MPVLSKDAILAADDLQKKTVPVPEWGGEVMVRMMTAAERDRLEEISVSRNGEDRKANLANFRARLCAFCICDEQGGRLFTEDEISALGKKSAAALDRIYDAAAKLNRMGGEEVEALVKN